MSHVTKLIFRNGCLAVLSLLAMPVGAATIVVNSAADSGAGNCTLREAIQAANSNAVVDSCVAGSGASDTINFAITPLDGSVKTIAPATPLPDITAPVLIEGYSQNGATANTLPSGSNAVPKIVLNGATSGGYGLTLTSSAGGSTIRGLVIQNFGDGGIQMIASSGNTIRGNFIGTNAAATAAAGNGSNGLRGGIFMHAFGVGESIANTIIGGTNNADRNVISGNSGAAISLYGGTSPTGNRISGNLIGTSKNGMASIPNSGRGIDIGGGIGVIIGEPGNAAANGPCSGGCNLVSGNYGQISAGGSATADGTVIQSNYVGNINITGNAVLPSAIPNLSGVMISGAAGSPANLGMTIGGTTALTRNIISANEDSGVDIQNFGNTLAIRIIGNHIGTNVAGTAALANASAGVHVMNTTGVEIGGTAAGVGNLISANTYHGIWLEGSINGRIQSNRIGTQVDGTSELGNGRNGIYLGTNGFDLSDGNLVGADIGSSVGGNIIAFNAANQPGGDGIVVTSGVNNRFSRNVIFANKNLSEPSGLGIDLLGFDEQTPNDDCDLDGGPNNLQNGPAFVARTAGGVTTVSGLLNSTPNTTYTLEFYATPPEVDPALAPEAKLFLGSTSVTTGAMPGCTVNFSVPTTTPAPAGHIVTAIAIAPNGDTSELALPDNLFANSFE
jgi:CSLREA domain-containing protein